MIKRLIRIVTLSTLLLLAKAGAAVGGDFRFYVYNAANGLADNSAQTINCTKTGRLVITTMGQINFYDGQHFTYIDPTTENTYPLSKYNGHAHLYFDRHHHLWLKKRHTLTCVNLTREMFVDDIKDEFKALGMNDQVEDLFVDDQLTVWLLTAKGLYNTETSKYYTVEPKLVLQDLQTYQDKYLLLFYDNGQLDVHELSSGSLAYSSQAYDNQMAARFASSSIVKQIDGMFYQIRNGDNEGLLLRFDIGKWEWQTLMETPYYLSNMTAHDSLIYVPSAYGFWTLNPSTGEKTHTEYLQMANGQQLLTDINAMEFDKQGGLWVGTEKRGLLYARPLPTPFQVYGWTDARALQYAELMDQTVRPVYKYRDKSVNCVFHDSRGWDWVGTSTGLQCYRDKSDNLPQIYTRYDGLLNNVIHCIIEDQLHNIWVGTSYGVCCLLIRDGKVRYINSYNQWDGIPSESFVNGRTLIQPDGTIVMQALDHVVAFNPTRMVTLRDTTLMEIYPKLVKLYVNGNDMRAGEKLGGNVILERALTRTKEINLNYDQNSVSLTFSGLNYFRPRQTFYRVLVEGPGMDGKWKVYTPYNSQGLVDGSGQLHLPLASLVPGSYSIQVQASLLPDTWNTTPYEWIINVNEPWWRTTGIIALMGSLLLVLLGIFLYLFLRNANLKARRNNEEQGVIKRIKAFAERCDASGGLLLEPSADEVVNSGLSSIGEFSPEFTKTMLAIIPVVVGKSASRLSMRELSNAAGMSLKDFYAIITSNIYKNPRPVAMQIQLERAAAMLKEKPRRSIAEIAQACGFVSPNYFIASFYHRYKQLPETYS